MAASWRHLVLPGNVSRISNGYYSLHRGLNAGSLTLVAMIVLLCATPAVPADLDAVLEATSGKIQLARSSQQVIDDVSRAAAVLVQLDDRTGHRHVDV